MPEAAYEIYKKSYACFSWHSNNAYSLYIGSLVYLANVIGQFTENVTRHQAVRRSPLLKFVVR
jgi:hypothetical protein